MTQVGSGTNAPFNALNQHTIRVFGAGTDRLTLPADVIAEFISTGYQDGTKYLPFLIRGRRFSNNQIQFGSEFSFDYEDLF